MIELDPALHREVDRLRRLDGHSLSAHAFPSLCLWGNQQGLSLTLAEDCFAVRAEARGSNAWFFPCGSQAGKGRFLEQRMEEPDLELLYLRREDAAWLEAAFPGRWDLCRTPGRDEYLYRRAAHVEMRGGPFRHLRRRVHRIQRELNPRTRPLDEHSAGDAMGILELWAQSHPGPEKDDRQVALLALERRRELGMKGVVVDLGGQPVAFMLGFPLTEDTFDAAVGKCAAGIQGLTYYVLRELMLSLPRRFQWFNLEEDLGLPGLRAMKEHFLPDGRQEIWEARRI